VTGRDRRGLPDIVAERLLAAVNEGHLKPGEQLPTELDLAAQLGVGRTSLREAIQRLRTIGVLEVRNGLGTFVVDRTRMEPVHSFVQWSVANEFEVTEVFEARMSIEVSAAGLAGERAGDDDIAALQAAAQQHREATSIEELIDTDENFHAALVRCAGNSLLERLYSMLVPGLREFRRMSLAIPASAARSAHTHDAIVEAIVARDPFASRSATLEHLWDLYSLVTTAGNTNPTSGAQRKEVADRRAWFDD
jgi:GntR family transcriptional repressor for pyruvate dehydrogenase complex